MVGIYILWGIPGVIQIFYIIRKWRNRSKRCTLKIPVRVIEVIARKPRSGNAMLYKPIFETFISGERKIIDSARSTMLFQLEEGQELYLYVNPSDIQDFTYDSPYKEKIIFLDKIACIAPFLFIILFRILY